MHARSFVVAGAAKESLLEDLNAAITTALEEGTGLEAFRAAFDETVKKHGWAYNGSRNWRTRVIFQTNLRTAYAAGRYQQMMALTDHSPYWMYHHSPVVLNPRDQHLAWHGKV